MELLRNYREVRLLLSLRLNPTITRAGDHYLFLTNIKNVESFQRIPHNAVVELIYTLISKEQKGVVFNGLINQLKEQIEATADELEAYINQLIDTGFFEFYLGISGIDPDWEFEIGGGIGYADECEGRRHQ